MKRAAQLTRHFKIETAACINKWDINTDVSKEIEDYCVDNDVRVVGKIRYDKIFTDAQLKGANIFEVESGDISGEVKSLWENLERE